MNTNSARIHYSISEQQPFAPKSHKPSMCHLIRVAMGLDRLSSWYDNTCGAFTGGALATYMH